MPIELLFIVLGVTLFGGMFFACFFAVTGSEAYRAEVEASEAHQIEIETPAFFATPIRKQTVSSDLLVRQLEHYLRQEVKVANLFVDHPSPETLWLGREPVMDVA